MASQHQEDDDLAVRLIRKRQETEHKLRLQKEQ
jgi:hypothetical protein